MKIVNFSQNLSSDLLSKHLDLGSDLDIDLEDENDENDEIDSSATTEKRVIFISDSSDIHISMLSISKKTFESNAESHFQFHFEFHSESYSFYFHLIRMQTSDSDSHMQLYIKLNTTEFKKSFQ